MQKRPKRRSRALSARELPAYAVAIRRLQEKCALKDAEFASRLKVSPALISFWKSAVRKPGPSNLTALRAFALKEGLKEFAVPFELELEKLARAEKDKRFLQDMLKRARAGDGYARRLLEASERPVAEYAEEKAAALFEAFLESPETWMDQDPAARIIGGRPSLPAEPKKRAPAMRSAVGREIVAVRILRQAQNLWKPNDDILMWTLIEKGLERRANARRTARQRAKEILRKAVAQEKEGKAVDMDALFAEIAPLVPQGLATHLGEGIARIESVQGDVAGLLGRLRQLHDWAHAWDRAGQPISEEALKNLPAGVRRWLESNRSGG